MKTELEQILPEKIEERSFEIISEELNALFPEKTFLPEEELILKTRHPHNGRLRLR